MKKYLLFLSSLIMITLSGCTFGTKNNPKTTASNAADSVLTMPYNKVLKPAGQMIFFGDSALENHALDVALSPDHKTLAIEGRYSVVFVNTADNKILYRLVLRQYNKGNAMNTYSGIQWFVDKGKQYVLWGTRNNVMQAQWNGSTAEIVKTFNFPRKKGVRASIPNELVIRRENGKPVFYVVLNGNDEVAKVNMQSGKKVWQKPVGLAPYGITWAKGKLNELVRSHSCRQ